MSQFYDKDTSIIDLSFNNLSSPLGNDGIKGIYR